MVINPKYINLGGLQFSIVDLESLENWKISPVEQVGHSCFLLCWVRSKGVMYIIIRGITSLLLIVRFSILIRETDKFSFYEVYYHFVCRSYHKVCGHSFFFIIILIDDLRLTCKNDYNRYDYKSLGVDI